MALEPITRQEKIIAGQNLTPITRMEKFLKEYGGSGGGTTSVQSDWNQTDETAADFIKNKPFGDMPTVILEEQELIYSADDGGCIAMSSAEIQDGATLIIVSDGVSYECKTEYNENFGGLAFGNMAILGEPNDTGEPFFGAYVGGILMFVFADEANHTVKITANVVDPIEERFIPDSVKDDKGPIVLYMDDEKYLYAEVGTNLNADYDTSDTTKRITQGDLKGLLASGRAIYFLCGEYKDTYIPAWIRWRGAYGTAGCNIIVNDVVVDIVAYTAEYTS